MREIKRMFWFLIIGMLLISGTLFHNNLSVWACAPSLSLPIREIPFRPDISVDELLNFKIGIINHKYAVPYQWWYYYVLSNERPPQTVVNEFKSYLNGEPLKTSHYEALTFYDADQLWKNAIRQNASYFREKLGKESFDKIILTSYTNYAWIPETHQHFVNCAPDAFIKAAALLKLYEEKWDLTSNQLAQWLSRQRDVFENCVWNFSQKPQSLEPEWLNKKDSADDLEEARQYQRGAWYFYRRRYFEAIDAFSQIIQDKNHLLRSEAAISRARAHLRIAQNLNIENLPKQEAETHWAKAKELLEDIITDESMNIYHSSANKLLGFIEARQNPQIYLERIGAILSNSEAQGDEIRFAFEEIAWMRRVGKLVQTNNLMLEWIRLCNLSVREETVKKNKERIIQIRKNNPDNLAWIWLQAEMACLGTKEEKELVLKIIPILPRNHSAYWSFQYTRWKIRADIEEDSQVLNEIEKVLTMKSELDNVSLNRLRRMAFNLENDPIKRLRWATFISVGSYYGERCFNTYTRGQESLDSIEGDKISYGLSPRLWKEALKDKNISPCLRERMSDLYVVRQILLEDFSSIADITIKDNGLKEALENQNVKERTWELIRWLYENLWVRITFSDGLEKVDDDAFQIPAFRWWRTIRQEQISNFPLNNSVEETERIKWLLALSKIEYPGIYFSKKFYQWAVTYANDSRAPEALHYAVQSTKRAPVYEEEKKKELSRLSKLAFQRLLKRYPNSSWSKKTPYWY